MNPYETAQQRIRSRGRTWLVTGAAGFIGSHLVENLLNLDQAVVGLDNFATGKPENLEHVRAAVTARGGEARWQNFRFIEGDIRSARDCASACQGVDVVLHQAALGSVPRSIDDPVASSATNVMGFLNMQVAARDAGVQRFVYASSSAVYGDHPALPKVEAVTGRAMSPYGLTKWVNELYADVFDVCYGFKSIGLRYFNVFGPRQDPNGAYASVIPAWIGALMRGQVPYINGDGTAARDFCHVDNVVQANLLAATVEDPLALGQAYNIALGDQTSLTELYEMIRAGVARKYPHAKGVKVVHREPRRGDLQFSRADTSKAQRLLGYRPAVRIMEGLQKTIDWYAQNIAPVTDQRKVAHA
ncbi:MAG TPA: SDR family oxidoreductase [Burkholderiales bacterium]|nr:SDR family oxidoreductase [Burkholderiales bacterium]